MAVNDGNGKNILGKDNSPVKVAAHRLRHRYREALRSEIANTVSRDDDVEEEFTMARAKATDNPP